MASDIALLTAWASDDDVALGGIAPALDDLTPGQFARQQMLIIGFFRVREYAWLQYQDGLLDEQAWIGYVRPLLRSLHVDGGNELNRILWDQFSAELDEDFVQYINQSLAEQ